MSGDGDRTDHDPVAEQADWVVGLVSDLLEELAAVANWSEARLAAIDACEILVRVDDLRRTLGITTKPVQWAHDTDEDPS